MIFFLSILTHTNFKGVFLKKLLHFFVFLWRLEIFFLHRKLGGTSLKIVNDLRYSFFHIQLSNEYFMHAFYCTMTYFGEVLKCICDILCRGGTPRISCSCLRRR